jgi:GntR family transcriptional repressor for pyruvate dehydrogenase complex
MPAQARSPVAQDVFERLLELVLSGRYEPGEKLPTQRELAGDLGVTMGSLREALKRLEQMDLISVRQGDAMRVRDWRDHGGLDVIAHVLLRSGGLDARILRDVLEARGLMLQELAALAATRRSDEAAQRLAELAQGIADSADDAAAQLVDFAFFEELAHAADNVVFRLIMNTIRELYFANAHLLPVTARRDELAPLYARAAGAIADGDPELARVTVAELASLQRARIEELLPL